MIDISWFRPFELSTGSRNKVYSCDLDEIPDVAGVYVFGRSHGVSFAPVYIGESENVRKRVSQHIDSVPLMLALKNAKNGTRHLHVGTIKRKSGQPVKLALQRVERAMIKYALAQGHELVNYKGTKTPYDAIAFSGNLDCRRVFGRSMHVERRP